MKHFLLYIIASGSLVLLISNNSLAQSNPSEKKDNIPSTIIPKVRVLVKDLTDGKALDSVLVTAGFKKAYTNTQGYAEFDSLIKGTLVTVSRSGFLVSSKRAKPGLTIRLERKEPSSVSKFANGLYERPADHSSAAYTVVSGEDLRKLNPLNFVDALKILAPSFIASRNNAHGDDPNTASSVKIRGSYNFPASATIANHSSVPNTNIQINPSIGDFAADNVSNPDQPLVLLDGVQVSLQMALDMDINRIEKITVLKDAAATSEYGVRGGNGVLLIQTKKPVPGNLNITYSGQVQISSADLSSYRMLNASNKLQMEQAAGLFTNNSALYNQRLYQVNKGVNTDWLSIPTRTGVGMKHYLALEGGDDDISYGLDFSYNDIQGVMKGSSRQNTNVGGYISTRVKTITISNYLSYGRSNAINSPYGNLSDYTKLNPYWSPYDSVNGGYAKVLEESTSQGTTVRYYNPAYNGQLSTTDERDYSRFFDLLSLNWNIGHGFSANGHLSLNQQSDEENIFLPPGHTSFAEYSPDDFFKRGQYNQTSSEFLSAEGAFHLNYSKRMGLHQFYASAGMSAMQTQSQSSGIELTGFTSDKLSDLSFGSAYSGKRPQAGMINTRLASGYGNITYSYDNRYQLELTGNTDASSQFGSNHSLAPHGSVGASWNLHQERFFHENKIINNLRLRASIGTAGSLSYPSYLGYTTYNYYTDRQYIQGGSNSGTRGIGLGSFLTGYGNDDLKAPQTEKQNIGLDLVLLQNRLFLTADIYRNHTTDIVLPVTSLSSTGFLNYNYYDNLGAIETRGVEFSLNYRIINNTKKGIVWSVMLNGIHEEDRVKSISSHLDDVNAANDAGDQTEIHPHYVAGQSLTGIWAVRSMGIDPATGQEKFLKADGTQTTSWSAADKIMAGDLNPKMQGSFGTAVSVKNISAGIYFNYQYGASAYNQTLADWVENADVNFNVDQRATGNRWTQPGDAALYKPLSVNGLVSSPTYVTTRFVEKNDFINCASISLGYNLPESITSKVRAKAATIGFIANNAFHSSTMAMQHGIEYPFQRMYTFSITTHF
ncbi:MAG: SusC/RagA family TonB-linked outer membrane protein [Flavisolibacter sp.]